MYTKNQINRKHWKSAVKTDTDFVMRHNPLQWWVQMINWLLYQLSTLKFELYNFLTSFQLNYCLLVVLDVGIIWRGEGA